MTIRVKLVDEKKQFKGVLSILGLETKLKWGKIII